VNPEDTARTIALMKEAHKLPAALGQLSELAKAFTQSSSATSGLTAYDLEAPAKTLYPVLTPLRNIIPRVGSAAPGIQAAWRAITAINTANVSAGVGQGNRSGVISTQTKDYTASYKGLGLEDYATFEADYAAQGFDDIKARTVQGLLRSLMLQEERIILGGFTATGLGTTPTPTLTTATTGGTIANAAAFSVICVALTLDGLLSGSIAGGINGSVTRTNADGSSDTYGGGSARKSTNATIATTGSSTSTVSASVTAVTGAGGYAW